jgi:hypothetical protein
VYVLIAILFSASGTTNLAQEFSTLQACEYGRAVLSSAIHKRQERTEFISLCVPK